MSTDPATRFKLGDSSQKREKEESIPVSQRKKQAQMWPDMARRGWTWLDVAGHAWLMGQSP